MSLIRYKQNELQEDNHSCPDCDLVLDYFNSVTKADSQEELFAVLSGLVQDAKKMGFKDAIEMYLFNSMNILDQLDDECDCEGCCNGECDSD